MSTIDFTKIRSAPKSRNDSFEALSVQLFRHNCTPPVNSSFVSLRGDGGDGGVEAYFRAPRGEILGVQAKYLFKLRAAELSQISKSLDTALENHPDLAEYWIYIPFDLTGRVAGGSRGTSEAERFEVWKTEVEATAAKRARPLKVVLCTAAVIRSQLLHLDKHGGMRRYWFDGSVLTPAQIQNGLEVAAAFAGPRFSSALDVVTNAHAGLDFFGGIGDFQGWREGELSPALNEFRELRGWGDKSLEILGKTDAGVARKLVRDVVDACAGITNFSVAGSQAELALGYLRRLSPLLAKARDAQEKAFDATHGREKDTPNFRQFMAEYMCTFPAGEMDAARKWEESSLRLQSVLASQEIGAATTHSLLLVGPAGIGKTHAIVSAALRRFARGGSSLVVFGEDFGKEDPWEVVRSKLGFGSAVGRFELLECLEACATGTGLPFVLYIDALNETPQSTSWKNKLPELLAQCKPYPGIKICVSTRDTYRDLVVDSRFPGLAFEHVGFAGQEFEALQAFATYYGLDAEITPLFSPELCNPLFLHLACKTFKAEGLTSLDLSLPGFSALLDSHLKHCDALIRSRLQYSNPRNVVRASMVRLAETLIQNLPQERTWEACTDALRPVLGSELTPESMLKELQYEGLVILSPAAADKWLVRLGYQRYGDMLRANSLIEGVKQGGLDHAALAVKLSQLTDEDEGLLEALAAVLPETTGIELTAPELQLEPARAHRLFLEGLPWRSRKSVTGKVLQEVYGALNTPGLWQQCYEVFFRLSLVPDHPLNATSWLGYFLQKSSMVDRDAYLTIAALESFDAKGSVWSLIQAALYADVLRWPQGSRHECVTALAWLTSCSDRRIRDLSTKALTRVLGLDPGVGQGLLEEFQYCDDDYILESIALGFYGACLLDRDGAKDFAPLLERLLSPSFSDGQNVLVRDYVRLLSQLFDPAWLSERTLRELDAYPEKVGLPTRWPVIADAKPLLDLERLPSNMKLWGESLGCDFWRYQVESKIRDFDLEGAGISHENIACWIMTEALRLGYPGHEQVAHAHDLVLAQRYGQGRGRKGFAERLGKKYYWIALHRLLGLLADNVPPRTTSWNWRPGPGHLWSVDVRKIDPTDVRDISVPIEYPDDVMDWPRAVYPDRASDTKAWARQDDYPPHDESILRRSNSGEEWVAISLSDRNDDRAEGDDGMTNPYLGSNWFYTGIFASRTVARSIGQQALRDAFDSQGASCYRGFLAEYPDGPVFDQIAEEGYFNRGSSGMLFAEVTLSRGGEWEYDYSYVGPGRQDHLRVPCQDLIQVLSLKWDRQRGWIDSSGSLAAFASEGRRRHGLFVRRDCLDAYLQLTGRKLLLRRFANRGYFDHGAHEGFQMDRFNWLQYRGRRSLQVLRSEERAYGC
ncbi:hypothetical protein [Pseudoxanthomonas mexicana]